MENELFGDVPSNSTISVSVRCKNKCSYILRNISTALFEIENICVAKIPVLNDGGPRSNLNQTTGLSNQVGAAYRPRGRALCRIHPAVR